MASMFVTAIPESQFVATSSAVVDENPAMYELKGKIAATNQHARVQVYSA